MTGSVILVAACPGVSYTGLSAVFVDSRVGLDVGLYPLIKK